MDLLRAADAEPQSVCSLFEDPQALDGKRVVVRGELFAAESFLVFGTAVCEHEFVPHSFVWPRIVNLRPADPSETFTRVPRTAIEAARQQRERIEAVATFGGTIRLPREEDLRRWKGFGPGRGIPLEIEYDSMQDLVVKPLPASEELPTLSVCEVFSDLHSYRGQRVAVRGQYSLGYHGSVLFDHCTDPPLLGGAIAPTSFTLGLPDYSGGPHLAFLFASGEKPGEARPSLEDLKRGRKNVEVRATVVGRVRAMDEYDVWCQEGKLLPMGFGHMGAGPAKLLVETMLDFGVVPAPRDNSKSQDESTWTPCPGPVQASRDECQQIDKLSDAIRGGCAERVTSLLEANPDLSHDHNMEAFESAAASGFLDVVQLLVHAGADLQTANLGRKALCRAVSMPNNPVVPFLLTQGIDVNPKQESDCLPLKIAAERSDVDTLRMLISAGADIDARGGAAFPTALHAAVGRDRIEHVRALVDASANVEARSDRGAPMLPDMGYWDAQVAELLIEGGADVNAPGLYGVTALMNASEYAIVDVVELLLESGADPNLTDNLGNTALMFAVKGGYVDAIPLLLRAGADPTMVNTEGKPASALATGPSAKWLIQALERTWR